MKIKIIFFCLFIIFGLTNIHAQDDMFGKLSDHEDISTVYVSKALLKMMGANSTGLIDGVGFSDKNIKDLSSKLEQIEVYNGENESASKLMRGEMNKLLKNKSFEVFMKIKEKDENITFYGHKENSKFKDLIMFVDSKAGCTIIRIAGSFAAEDIQNIVKDNDK